MRTLLFTLISVAAGTVAFPATVYKWVDDNGVTHYSDQPHENAQKVELKAPQTYSAPKPAPASQQTPIQHNTLPARPAAAYSNCAISEPTNDQVFMNASAVVAGVSVQPAIRDGDTVVVTLDGQSVPGVPANGGQFSISPVERGTHSISMLVKDPNGATVCSSAAVTFHVQQPSLLSPTRPVKPH